MQAHVIERWDVRQLVLRDRQPELRLVDLHERGAVGLEQRQRPAERVAPALVPQFDGELVAAKRLEQPVQVVERRRVALEARRKLREEGAELAGGRKRVDAALELVD